MAKLSTNNQSRLLQNFVTILEVLNMQVIKQLLALLKLLCQIYDENLNLQ